MEVSNINSPDEIELSELWGFIKQRFRLIIVLTLMFSAGSVVYALNLPNLYRAQVLLAPNSQSGANALGGLASQFGGLASLAGINLNATSDEATMALSILQSREFLAEFILDNEMLVAVMAAEDWDSGQDQLIFDEDIYDPVTEKWTRQPAGLRSAKPSGIEAQEQFQKHFFDVTKDKETGYVSLSVTFFSPQLAYEWVNGLTVAINEEMRQRAKETSQKSIAFLKQKLIETEVSGLRTTLYQLIEEQTKMLMLTEVQSEYAFSVVDPAIVPEVKHSPKRALICILGAFTGGIIGLFLALILGFSSRNMQ